MIEIKNIYKEFIIEKNFWGKPLRKLQALNNINLNIYDNEILALVGESGSGKSTLARAVLRLIDIDRGKIFYNGKNIFEFNKIELLNFRKEVQIIFQDPYSSLNPKYKIRRILEEVLWVHGLKCKKEIEYEIDRVIANVGLNKNDLNKYPHEFSGGQKQRIVIARSLLLKPKFLVADEPVSALDVSVQAQILNLLLDLKDYYKFSMLFISHDLSVVYYIADRVAVMNKGSIVEIGEKQEVYESPKHDYTKKLLKSIFEIS